MGDIADDIFDEMMAQEGWPICEKHGCSYDPEYGCPECEEENDGKP